MSYLKGYTKKPWEVAVEKQMLDEHSKWVNPEIYVEQQRKSMRRQILRQNRTVAAKRKLKKL